MRGPPGVLTGMRVCIYKDGRGRAALESRFRMTLYSALFSDVFLPVMDGVAVAVYNYALWLNRRLGPSCVFTHGFPGYADREEFPVVRCPSIRIPQRPPYRIGVPQLDVAVHQKLRRMKLDLVHAHSPFTAGRMALQVARKRKIPLVATFHTKYRDDFETNIRVGSIVDWGIRGIVKFYSQADQVWVPNSSTGETLKSYGYEGEYEVVPNGADLGNAENPRRLREEGGRLLGMDPENFVFLFVGQHVWEKNLAFLIEVLALLKSLGRRFRSVFVGEGYARPQMEKMIEEAGLRPDTRFVGVVHDRKRLMAYYARADLFLFPSLYDNAPLAVKEAACFGVPSVLLAQSNAAENVTDGVNGFLAPGSVEAYAEKLAVLMDDPRLVKRVGRKAQKTLYLSWEAVVGEVIDRYTKLIAGR